MVAGIAAPNPSGIPGFNEAYITNAGGVGVANAVPLKSWYNIILSVPTAAGAVMLPPAAPTMQVLVLNNSGQFPNTVAGSVTVFGNVNDEGQQDTIANATGVQGTTGVAVAANAVGLFFVVTPQAGFTNEPVAGQWQYKVLA
jgi:hypothetical protein